MSSNNLFSDFQKVSDQSWLDKIEKDLKGKSASEIAKARKYEGIDLKVFYSETDKNENLQIIANNDWQIIESEDYVKETMSDPIYNLVSTGNWVYDNEQDLNLFVKIFKEEIEGKNLGIDAALYQNAGASAFFELACTISHLNEYLHFLKKHHVLTENFLSHLSIKVSIGSDYFLEISKLRALRILVNDLAKAYKLHELPFTLYAENSLMNYSSADVDTNILRSTTACMSAVIGSCDKLIINPHDMLVKEWHEFGDRIARNIQLLMKHEAHLDKVNDPASGSYYIEWLTKKLADKAWKAFKEIENKGGFVEAFKSGYIQKEIESTAKLRMQDVNSGEKILVGINKYQKDGSGVNRRKLEWQEGDYITLKPLFLEDSAN